MAQEEVYRTEGIVVPYAEPSPPCRYPAGLRRIPYPSCHAFKTAKKFSVNPRLATLSMLSLRGRPSWNSPRAGPACPLIVPPGMPPIYMTFGSTPCAELRALIVVGRLSQSHIADGCGRGWCPQRLIHNVIALGLIPVIWMMTRSEQRSLPVIWVLPSISLNFVIDITGGSRPSRPSSALHQLPDIGQAHLRARP